MVEEVGSAKVEKKTDGTGRNKRSSQIELEFKVNSEGREDEENGSTNFSTSPFGIPCLYFASITAFADFLSGGSGGDASDGRGRLLKDWNEALKAAN